MTELERCPRCKCLGSIDEEQEEGKVSLICPICGHHYYKTQDNRLQEDFKEDKGFKVGPE